MNTISNTGLKGMIIISMLFFCKIAESQDFTLTLTDAYYFTPQNLGTTSPQAANMIKYGNPNMDYYNGLFSMEVPVYTYKDRDFELPISVKYVSNPFIPAKRSSIVGYNWMLNAGGVITREVHGSPDDNKGKKIDVYADIPKYMPDGALVAIRNGTFKTYSETVLKKFNMDRAPNGKVPYAWSNKDDFKHDFSPDIFNFSFGEHSGSFIIGNGGIPVLLKNQGYKVDITGLAVQEYSVSAVPANSTIKITCPKGYVYEFGGNSSYFEYFVPNNPASVGKVKPRYITSWFLKSIQAPSGRQVVFTYESVKQENRYHYFVYNTANNLTTTTYDYQFDSPQEQYYVQSTTLKPSYDKKIDIKDLIYSPLIKSIKIDNVTSIVFNSKDRFTSFYGDSSTDDKVKCLDSIVCKYNNSTIHNIHFEYLDKGQYSFLQKVRKTAQSGIASSQDEIYEFTYNFLNKNAPSPKTVSLNHWGGWSGGYETTANTIDYCNNIMNKKAVNTAVCDFGMLQKVIYPTKGYSEIEYEYNRFNRWKEKSMAALSLIDKYSANPEPCFGARVKTIKDYDPVQNKYSNVRTFEYKSPSAGANDGSGVISFKPEYLVTERIVSEWLEEFSYIDIYGWERTIGCKTVEDQILTTLSSNSFSSELNLAEYPVGYTDVVEKFQDGSYIHHQYSSWLSAADDLDIEKEFDGIKDNFTYYNKPPVAPYPSHFTFKGRTDLTIKRGKLHDLMNKYGLYICNDMSRFRGKLLNKTIYSSTGTVVYKEENTYNTSQAKSKYQFSITSLLVGCVANKIYTFPCLLTKQVTTETGNIQKQSDYAYNDFGFVKSISTKDSENKEYMKRYKYTGDYNLSVTNALDRVIVGNMVTNNLINYLVEEQTLVKKSGVWNLLNGRISKYGNTNVDKMKKPVAEYILETHEPLTDIEESKLASNGALTFNNKYRERTVFSNYDNSGNPLFVKDNGVDNIVYLWAYKSRYLIAEIRGATYSDVCKIIGNGNEQTGKTALETIAAKVTPSSTDFTTVNNLRTQIPDAMVTTYKYQPLVGMLTMTDPRGIVTNYGYDTFWRLNKVTTAGRVVEAYGYNYKN